MSGLIIALDCANGSASANAKRLFEGLGASVYVINASPNGVNINENCGSTHINNLMQFVIDKKCHAGLAFDGDADRCLAVDEKGELVDGDKLIAVAEALPFAQSSAILSPVKFPFIHFIIYLM